MSEATNRPSALGSVSYALAGMLTLASAFLRGATASQPKVAVGLGVATAVILFFAAYRTRPSALAAQRAVGVGTVPSDRGALSNRNLFIIRLASGTLALAAGSYRIVQGHDAREGLLFLGVGLLVVYVSFLAFRGRVFGPVRHAWGEVNGPPTTGQKVVRLGGALAAVAFVGLMMISFSFVEPAFGQFDLVQQLVRIVALVFGVLLVLLVLADQVPLSLLILEQQSFVSFVSARLVRATKSGFLTVISVLSILGVALSSCALCSVTSIMGGFGHDLKRKILGNTAHIQIDGGPAGFEGWKPALEGVRAAVSEGGGAVTAVVAGDAMASSSTNTAGVQLRGIDPDTFGDVIKLERNVEIGSLDFLTKPEILVDLPPDTVIGRGPGGEPYYKGPGYSIPGLDMGEDEVYPTIILGRELAKSLHVMMGDELTLLSPMGELGPTGIMPRARKFRVGGIFYSGLYEFDASHAYVLMAAAQAFFDMETRVSTIEVRVPAPEQVDQFTPGVKAAIGVYDAGKARAARDPLRVRDWKEMNKNLFSALKLEKIATFIILSIAIAVASFCIICTLLLMVTEKAKEIALLKALGATERAIMRIFVLEGVIIGGIGTILGVATALAACLGLSWTGIRLDPEVYYIDRLPVNVDPVDYATIAIAAFVICSLSTIYPAVAAARVRPVDGLRYE